MRARGADRGRGFCGRRHGQHRCRAWATRKAAMPRAEGHFGERPIWQPALWSPAMIASCAHCGQFFNAPPYQVRRGFGRYCSRDCAKASRPSISERFWNHVDRSHGTAGCWPWTAHRNSQGYGQVQVDGRSRPAHRVAWSLTNGSPPSGLLVCHSCDNPPCCNPGHLFLGTHKDNADDCMRKGRHISSDPQTCPRAKLTWADVHAIRRQAHRSRRELAASYGVHKKTIGEILRGNTWRAR
jgi:hypothetical protein